MVYFVRIFFEISIANFIKEAVGCYIGSYIFILLTKIKIRSIYKSGDDVDVMEGLNEDLV